MKITNETNEQLEITLYDVLSREMLHQTFIQSISLNLEQLPNGIYFYQIQNGNNVYKKGKMLKE